MFLAVSGGERIQLQDGVCQWKRGDRSAALLLPGVVWQHRLVVVLQDSLHLAHDVELPVVQDLSQVGHAAHVHPLSWVKTAFSCYCTFN